MISVGYVRARTLRRRRPAIAFPIITSMARRHPPPLHLHQHQHQPAPQTIATTQQRHHPFSTHYIHRSGPCSGESQQQCPLRPEESSQPPPGPASFHPFVHRHLRSQQSVGGSTTRKISLSPLFPEKSTWWRYGIPSESPRHRLPFPSHCVRERSANLRSTARPLQQTPKCRFHVQD
jgi:hypothetical protein